MTGEDANDTQILSSFLSGALGPMQPPVRDKLVVELVKVPLCQTQGQRVAIPGTLEANIEKSGAPFLEPFQLALGGISFPPLTRIS